MTEQAKYLGLPRATAMSIFDCNKFGEKAVEESKVAPKTAFCDENVKIEWLISYDDTPCFAEKRYTLSGGKVAMEFGPAVWAIVDGEGRITGENYERALKRGDYFFLPFAAEGKFFLEGNLTAIECLPSKR